MEDPTTAAVAVLAARVDAALAAGPADDEIAYTDLHVHALRSAPAMPPEWWAARWGWDLADVVAYLTPGAVSVFSLPGPSRVGKYESAVTSRNPGGHFPTVENALPEPRDQLPDARGALTEGPPNPVGKRFRANDEPAACSPSATPCGARHA